MNNPPAFPCSNQDSTQDCMSLRDYFAAAALIGELASDGPDWHLHLGEGESRSEAYAKSAYRYADAMLAERDKAK